MGREQKRREARKNKHKEITKTNNNEGTISLKTTIKLVVVVAAILIILYLCLALFITKEMDMPGTNKEETTETDTAASVSNKILASNTFKQSDEVYYVYYYDFDEEEDAIKNSISNLTDHTIYRVDTGSSLNTNYVSEESNKNAKTLEELKVKNPTLIKVENDSIKEYYEGIDSIRDYINNK